ncbi:hypothetical protein [Runella sp.]|uniref:hypothetical protein n=1 Tax=Runella sp. TaxID=1960881 RepID=UPI003D098967
MFLFRCIVLLFLLTACEPKTFFDSVPPFEVLKLTVVTPDFAGKTASFEGQAINEENNELGLVYSESPLPTLTAQKAASFSQNDQRISGRIDGLQTGKRYYFRLYKKNGGTTVYSNQLSTVLSPDWQRLPDIPYEGQPLPYGWLYEYSSGYQLAVYTRTTFVSESQAIQWAFFSATQQWQTYFPNNISTPARYNPIYLPYADEDTYFFGAGYFYIPEPHPVYMYQKNLSEYRGTANEAYPGDDVPTVQFAIGGFLPDLYVLEVGNQYRLWKYQNRLSPSGWQPVSGGEFPRKELKKPLAFSVGTNGFVLSEEDGSLWAFDPVTVRWTARKNIPFKDREKGAIVTISKGGVYGLGYNPKTGEGYRDLWLYDDKADTWSYLTDYPGEGNVNITAVGRTNRVGFMMGYRATATAINTAEFGAAKDVWIYEPK